tara:strand:- start:332 stop:448 length:117 start_codon:yes stop_codon:yes gene_type:complete
MMDILNQVLVTIPPGYTGLVEFFGMLTIGVAAGSLGVL